MEETRDDAVSESLLLILVHVYDDTPIICYFVEVQRFGEIDNIEDVFLEAATILISP